MGRPRKNKEEVHTVQIAPEVEAAEPVAAVDIAPVVEEHKRFEVVVINPDELKTKLEHELNSRDMLPALVVPTTVSRMLLVFDTKMEK